MSQDQSNGENQGAAPGTQEDPGAQEQTAQQPDAPIEGQEQPVAQEAAEGYEDFAQPPSEEELPTQQGLTPEELAYQEQLAQEQAYAQQVAEQEAFARQSAELMGIAYVPGGGEVNKELKESNTKQYIKAAIGIVVILIGAAIALTYWFRSQKEMERHEEARAKFEEAHVRDYLGFWTKAQISITTFADDKEFERHVTDIVRKTPVAYGKYLKEQVLPMLDRGVTAYEAISAPPAYADKLAAVIGAYKGVRDEFRKLDEDLLKLEGFAEGQAKIEKMDNAWYNSQSWEDHQYYVNGFKYYQFLSCVVADKKLVEMAPSDITVEISKACQNDKAGWFGRVAFECFPLLAAGDAEADARFKETIFVYRKRTEDKVDETSRGAITDCVKAARPDFNTSLAKKVVAVAAVYDKARKEFLEANNLALGKGK